MGILNLLHRNIYESFNVLFQLSYEKIYLLFISGPLVILLNTIVGIMAKVVIWTYIYNSSVCNTN